MTWRFDVTMLVSFIDITYAVALIRISVIRSPISNRGPFAFTLRQRLTKETWQIGS